MLVSAACAWVVAAAPRHSSGLRPAPHVAPVEFRNIALSSGVRFVLNNSATPHKYQIEPMVAGVAVFDYNRDGRPDLYFVNGARIPDLQKTGPEYYNRLSRNNGDGTYTDVTEHAGVKGEGYSMGVAAADYDNDGWLDLFVVNYCAWGLDKDPFCGSSLTGRRVYCHPSKFDPLPNTLYHNNHDGTFTNVSRSSGIGQFLGKGMGVAFADYDDDGYPDVFVANDTTRNFLFHNNGNGTFDEVGLQTGVAFNGDGAALSFMGADFRDVDNDGLPDLFVTAISNETFTYFHNLGGRLFEDLTPQSDLGRLSIFMSGWSNGIYDLNNDGRKDLIAANSHVNDNIEMEMNVPFKQKNAVFANAGGRFVDVSPEAGDDFQAAAAHRGAAFGDLDNDGKVDVVVSVLDSPAEIFRNVSPGNAHWLTIKTAGTRSNRDGIGAKIRLESASGVQYNHVTTSVGYASSSDVRVHFGLGPDTLVKALEIRWPSGVRQELHNIAADQILTVAEPRP